MLTLDVGCGSHPIGDVNCDILRPKIRIEFFVRCDAHYLPFKPKAFDRVISLEVLEHMHSPFHILKEIHAVLKEKGTIIISIPNPYYFRRILMWIFKEKITVSKDHIYIWTTAEINNLLKIFNFKLTETNLIDTYYHKKSIVHSLLPRITKHSMLIKGTKVEDR